jgi:small-conductance mechanosensitive channel
LGVSLLAWIWVEELLSLSTFLGLVSAGLAIALREPLINLMGWAFIVWRRPFEMGDRIEIGGQAGDVIDMRVFQFTLLEIGNWVDADQSTGRAIHVPNGKVFSESLANYSKGLAYIWNEIPVRVTFESDW